MIQLYAVTLQDVHTFVKLLQTNDQFSLSCMSFSGAPHLNISVAAVARRLWLVL